MASRLRPTLLPPWVASPAGLSSAISQSSRSTRPRISAMSAALGCGGVRLGRLAPRPAAGGMRTS
ncbi:MAG: hypothetical protein U5L06_11690 [Rhodovibrio sp.]|nr:hypothetical protein [Rhodovibrio sp.]